MRSIPSKGIIPVRAADQKGIGEKESEPVFLEWTDGPTDGRTDPLIDLRGRIVGLMGLVLSSLLAY